MIEQKNTKVIPEHEVEETVYIANDGTRWLSKSACENYEEGLAVLAHPVFRSRVDGFFTLDEGRSASLYKITCNDDYEFFTTHRGDCTTNYNRHGPGWYLYWETSDGDYDDQWLWNVDAYIKEKSEDLKEFITKVEAATKEDGLDDE